MKMKRNELPVALAGATNFSDDRDELDVLFVIRLLKSQKDVCDRLVSATTISSPNASRRRTTGSWSLAYIAFVASRKFADWEPWWSTGPGASDELWRECGFPKGRPPYSTMYDRFTELEQFAPEFQTTVGEFVQLGREKTGGLVGRDIHVDSCEEETHARLVHDCKEGESCKRAADIAKQVAKGRSQRRASGSPALHPDRETCKYAKEQREKLADEAPFLADPKMIGTATKVIDAEDENGRPYKRIKIGGCWYRSLDTEAGIRTYKKLRGFKFWHGFYNTKAVDHYTGAPVAITVESASRSEYHIYPELKARVEETLGAKPRAFVFDKGFSVESVFKANTEDGILTVAPFRQGGNSTREAYETDEYDLHGVPKCKHCTSEGIFVSFTKTPKPRIFYRCSINCPASRQADGRPGRQSILCEKKWRFLLPVFRTTELYLALRESHQSYERAHAYWRRRWLVGAANCDTRAKRNGRGTRQLRANAALVIEWLLICWREGWLGTPRRNENVPHVKRAKRQLGGLVAYRRRHRAAIGLARARAASPPGTAPPLAASP